MTNYLKSCWACGSAIARTPDQQWITLQTGSVYCSEDCCEEWEEHMDSTSSADTPASVSA